MGKFSAAKILDAMDQKLQKAFNYLIDLLETGYVTSARVNDKQTEIRITPQDVIQVLVDNKLVGGLKLINGELTFIAGALAGPNDTRSFIRVGDDPAMSAADFMYGWFNASGHAPYTKRFKISEWYGGVEFSAINDDSESSYLTLLTYIKYNNVQVISPGIQLYANSDVDGHGSEIYLFCPGTSTMPPNMLRLKEGLFLLIDDSEQNGLPVYVNNAAAISGGLTVGALYRTGGDPDTVCIVH